MRRAINNDPQALEDLLAAHHGRLLAYINKHLPTQLRPFVDSADVVQDTFFEACRLITGFKPSGENATFRWLVTIARHRMIDLLRMHEARRNGNANDRQSGDLLATMLSELAVYRRTPSRSAASHEFLAALEQAIQRLPPTHREILTLRHIDGLSTAEVAAQVQRSPEAVYWLCSRALEALRRDLRSVSNYF